MISSHSSSVTNGSERGTGCADSIPSSNATNSSNRSAAQNTFSGGSRLSQFMFARKIAGTEEIPVIESLHLGFSFPDGRGHPEPTQAKNASGRGGECLRAPVAAAVEAREPASPCVPPLTRRTGWWRLKDGYGRMADSLLGDVIGIGCIALTLLIFLIMTP